MLRFDFSLKHITNKSIRRVDNLSRKADLAESVKNNNENKVKSKKEWLEIRVKEKEQLLIKRIEK